LFTEVYYTRTDNKDDRVPRDIFLMNYRKYTDKPNVTFETIIDDIKRIGLVYDRNTTYKSPKTGRIFRGVIRGLTNRQLKEGDEVVEGSEFDEEDEPVKKPKKI